MSQYGIKMTNLRSFERRILKQYDDQLNRELRRVLPEAARMARSAVSHRTFRKPVKDKGLLERQTSAKLLLESDKQKRMVFYTNMEAGGPTYAPFPFFGWSTSQKYGARKYTEIARNDFIRKFKLKGTRSITAKFPLKFNPRNINRTYRSSPGGTISPTVE